VEQHLAVIADTDGKQWAVIIMGWTTGEPFVWPVWLDDF